MTIAHNGEHHETGSQSTSSADHAGHVQGSTTSQKVSFAEKNGTNSQMLFISGIALLVLAAVVAVWMSRMRKAAPQTVSSEDSTE